MRLDEHNSRVWPILKRLYRVWPRFSPEDRAFYLSTAESIAAAEKAKDEWNPKAVRSRYSQVTRNVAAAAKLAKELNAIFPPPWSNDAAPIGNLIEGLVSFVVGAVDSTHPWDLSEATSEASTKVQVAKKRLRKRGIHWELLRDLVWLASGKEQLHERTIRRYLDEQRRPKDPAAKAWKRERELLMRAARVAAPTHADVFTDALKLYLRSPVKS